LHRVRKRQVLEQASTYDEIGRIRLLSVAVRRRVRQ
jgi:hypothetical protein